MQTSQLKSMLTPTEGRLTVSLRRINGTAFRLSSPVCKTVFGGEEGTQMRRQHVEHTCALAGRDMVP